MFSHEGPSAQQLKETHFLMKFFAHGYSNPELLAKLAAENAEMYEFPKPDVIVEANFYGPEPGYVTTPICVVTSALVILEDLSHLPRKSGVLTPGAAFGDSTLLERMRTHEVIFEVTKSSLN